MIADFNKNNCLLTSMKQLPLELFKSVAFFLGHPVQYTFYFGICGGVGLCCFLGIQILFLYAISQQSFVPLANQSLKIWLEA